jgi:anti-sigma regulatory factor (Ser/Thr protein kinase)
MTLLGEIRVEAMIENLRVITHFVSGVSQRLHLDTETKASIDLALEEAAANVVKHAYTPDQSGQILVRIEIIDENLRLTITDWGIPYDETDREPFDMNSSIQTRIKRGTGLQLIHGLMDSVDRTTSQRCGGANNLVLKKRIGRLSTSREGIPSSEP